VRPHPAVFDDIFAALQGPDSLVLQAEKQRHKDVHAEVEIADLRGSVNTFEIMGPKQVRLSKAPCLQLEMMTDRNSKGAFVLYLTSL
jgi:ribonuclease P/MRP protein subunit POP1